MGGRVDKPRGVEGQDVAQDHRYEVGVPQALSPEIPGNDCGYNEAEDSHGRHVKFLLIIDHRIGQHVGQVDFTADAFDVRMLFAHKPSAVREEETSHRVYRIGVGLRVLVVHSVVTTPLVDRVLVRD